MVLWFLCIKLHAMQTYIRVGVVQWEARAFDHFEDFCDTLSGTIRALSAYRPDFILFPEYFSLCLANSVKTGTDLQMLQYVASFSEQLKIRFQEWARQYQVNILAGTMPVLENGAMYNICYLCHRDGKLDAYAKTHLTPFERGWELTAGQSIEVFETDCGPIGILICYDVEFPEAARKLALQGARLLFVPFQTDTQHGNNRVRFCARARAVENECYVITSGMVGNMPQLPLVEFQYGQSAVFSPSDHSFPLDGIVNQASLNIPGAFYCELDQTLLTRLHIAGSVRTLTDRRPELYGIPPH
jgi:predicted amidohydrolase